MPPSTDWVPQRTGDGSFTFFSAEFGETFHSREGARAEAFSKFAQATNLVELAQQGTVRLLDVCYGLGYNTAAALEVIWAVNPTCQVRLYGLELDPSVPPAAIAPALIESWPAIVQTVLQQLALQHQCHTPPLQASLLIGDARQTIQQLRAAGFQADGIFFDPFSPRQCPQLWSVEFFQQVAACLAPEGRLATYSRSAAVRKAMLEVGLAIGSMPLDNTDQIFPHQWSQGTIAAWSEQSLPPLSKLEREHLHTRAAIPYRDPLLTNDAETIRQRQRQEQQQSGLESTSSWRRRWGIK